MKVGDNWRGANKARRAAACRPEYLKRGLEFLGSQPPPHQLGDLGSAVSSPGRFGAEPQSPNGFRIFCLLYMTSPVHYQIIYARSSA